jgi:hypothetical protein
MARIELKSSWTAHRRAELVALEWGFSLSRELLRLSLGV